MDTIRIVVCDDHRLMLDAIRLAARGVDHDVVGRLAARLSRAERAEIV